VTQTELARLDASFMIPPVLDVTHVADKEIVHIGATPIAQYPTADVTMRRHVMVQLAEAGGLTGVHIAERFQVTPVYVSLLRGRMRAQGSAGLAAKRRGPKGAMKVTGPLVKRVRALRQTGLSYRAIATAVGQVSHQTVRRMLDASESTQPPVPDELDAISSSPDGAEAATGAEPEAREGSREPTPAVVGPSRYAGAMLLHVALSQLSLWQVFAERGAQVGRSALSVAQVIGMVAWGFALRLGSIEGFKTALAQDFGMLLGLPTVPCVQTLRTRWCALAESVAPDAILRALLAAAVRLEPVWEGAYYVDGHFSPYTGQAPVGKGWNAKRRLAEPGHTDVYVHDATGRALYFLNRPLNDSLVKVLPDLVREIRAVAPHQRVILVFDRGGYSGPGFRALTDQGIGFLTYLKGRKARRRFPVDRFSQRWWALDDPTGIGKRQRHVYRVYERGTRIRGAGLVRTVVVQDDEGHQIPVLTNCADLPAAKAVHLLRLRWRQENSFKYLVTHYGIDQIMQYGVTTTADTRLVDNPVRARVQTQLADARAARVFGEADVGQAVMAGASIRTAVSSTTRRVARAIEARITRLEHRLTQTPAKVPVTSLPGRRRKRATLKSDRHDLVTGVKLATYNAERLLARRFFQHYQDPRDWLTIFRSLLQLPGVLRQEADGTIAVQLQAPDHPRIQRALVAFLQDINGLHPRMFGTGPALRFEVQDRQLRLN